MKQAEQKQAIISAINAIDDAWLLTMIARLIYNITNEKQNGHRGNKEAAESVQSFIR